MISRLKWILLVVAVSALWFLSSGGDARVGRLLETAFRWVAIPLAVYLAWRFRRFRRAR